MIDAFSVAAGRLWAIEPDALRSLLAVAARGGDVAALATRQGRELVDAPRVEVRGDTAIVSVTGPIFRYAGIFTDICGATSTERLATDIQSALDNPAIKTLVLDIDSPGGEATGIHELSNVILAARSRKTIKAYVGGMGASAAYWIASAAGQIIVDDTAMVGSIGVVSTHTDTTQRDEKNGVRYIEIVSSASPDKRLSPTSEAGRARIQSLVDSLAEIFIADVARNRGVTRERVVNDFGKGHLVVGAQAVRAGMADGLGSFEGILRGDVLRSPTGSTGSRGEAPSSAPRPASQAGQTAAPATVTPVQSTASTRFSTLDEIFARREAARVGTMIVDSRQTGTMIVDSRQTGTMIVDSRQTGALPAQSHAPARAQDSLQAIFARRQEEAKAAMARGAQCAPVGSPEPVSASAASIFARRRQQVASHANG